MINTIKNPLKSLVSPEFKWIFLIYGSTYVSANTIDSFCKINHISDVIPKLIGVTAINTTMSIFKDRAFAQMFGNSNGQKVKMNSLMIWLLRDTLTISSAFILP